METTALRALVSSIFSDDKARVEFEEDPEKVMSRFELTAHEKKAVMTTHMRLGLVTAGSTKFTSTIGPMATWG
jgi:hypothetical protein